MIVAGTAGSWVGRVWLSKIVQDTQAPPATPTTHGKTSCSRFSKDQAHRGPGAALAPVLPTTDFLVLVAAFLIGIIIRPALVGPWQLSAVTPHSGTPLIPRLGPPPLSRVPLAVSDRPKEDSRSARCLLSGRGWDEAAPGRASGPSQFNGHRGTVPAHRALRYLSTAPGTAGPSQSTGHHKTILVHRAPRAGDAKMSKMKPTPEEEPKNVIIIYEKSGENTTPGDEPKETNSDEKSWDETNHDDKPKDGDGPGDGPDGGPDNGPKDGDNPGKDGNAIGAVIGAIAGAGLALVGLPMFIGALGFTGAGIAAGSIAAKMMSAAAIANGGGVAAGSTVAVLQSIGAAGFSLGAKVGLTSVLGSAGAASGAWLSKRKKPPSDKTKTDKNPSDKPKGK